MFIKHCSPNYGLQKNNKLCAFEFGSRGTPVATVVQTGISKPGRWALCRPPPALEGLLKAGLADGVSPCCPRFSLSVGKAT